MNERSNMKRSSLKLGILCGTIATALSVTPAMSEAPASDSTKTKPPVTETKQWDKGLGGSWSDRIFEEFQEMHQRMDRLFEDTMREVNQHTDWFDGSGFSSAVKLSDDRDHYTVRVSLPDRDLNNVEVKVESNNMLRITAKEEKKERTTSASKDSDKNANSSIYELGRYEQSMTLPGPVDASKMEIKRSGSVVTITLPKTGHTNSTTGHS